MRRPFAVAFTVVMLATACNGANPNGTATPEPVATLMAAGDIARCDGEADSATADLIKDIDGTVATLGDNVYQVASDETFAQCYDPAWGSFLDRTRPSLGNHDVADGGQAYYRYFGDAAGPPGEGWYSYELGAWHVIVLNSNCHLVACDEESVQYEWLVADLAASDAECTLAYWHHSRFSSGPHGSDDDLAPFWRALDEAGADLVLAAHDHLYERMAPQDADGNADPNGMRQFTVGTGGGSHQGVAQDAANSEVVLTEVFGVLFLTLRAHSYDWSFDTIDAVEADSGSANCQ